MLRDINLEKETARIVDFIRDYFHKAGFSKTVIGLSGGLDSSVSCALAALALEPQNILALTMPHSSSSDASLADAEELAAQLGIRHRIIALDGVTDPYFAAHAPHANQLRRGNWMARIRMCMLYDHAAAENRLVMGTGNRSELLIGYFTQFGDSACALEPIGHLYKTEVFELAKYLALPRSILEKKPTADLWPGQTDEEEIGLGYEILDRILHDITQRNITQYNSALPYSKNDFELTQRLYLRSAFKRLSPPMLDAPC